MAAIEGEARVLAAAQQIVKSLNTSYATQKDMVHIFSTFDKRLEGMSDYTTNPYEPDTNFILAENLILRWDSGTQPGRPWEESPDEVYEYLAAVDKIIEVTEDLSVRLLDKDVEIMDRAETVLQLAMSRLEDEFRQIMIRNIISFDYEGLNSSIRRPPAVTEGEYQVDDDQDGSVHGHDRGVSVGDDVLFDLVQPNAVVELRDIAERMIRSGYEEECHHVYTIVRRDVLDEYLSVLGVEKLSLEEVQTIDWIALDEKMKKWVQAVKIMVRVLLSGEKRLCEQIFCGSELNKEVCFVETTRGCVMQLLNFGEAVMIAKRTSEKLFRILDMYEAMVGLLPILEGLFRDRSGVLVRSEANVVLTGLGEAAIGTFVAFENDVRGEMSRKPIQGGDIHPLSRYVMNYLKLLVDYKDLLNALLGNNNNYKDASGLTEVNDGDDLFSENTSPVARRLQFLITSLLSNLEGKAKLYEDNAIQCVFLMNNVHYIVHKVKNSGIRTFLGDQWIRKHGGQIRQYAISYLRFAWMNVWYCLKVEGIGSGSDASKVLKERLKTFNACFEDIYRTQSAWKVSDSQLREELRLLITERVILPYRSFMGRFKYLLGRDRDTGKYIKYTPEDLEIYSMDLFEGTPAILNHMRRKI